MATGIASYDKAEFKGRRGFGGKRGCRQGSRKWVTLTDGSKIKWWGGKWVFSSERLNTKVATSLQLRAMNKATENGKMVVDKEVYEDFDVFAHRMVGIMGLDAFMKALEWIRS